MFTSISQETRGNLKQQISLTPGRKWNPGIKLEFSGFKLKQGWGQGDTSVGKHLPGIHKALDSALSTTKPTRACDFLGCWPFNLEQSNGV